MGTYAWFWCPPEYICRNMLPATAHEGKHAYQEVVERGGHPNHVRHTLLPLHCYAFLQHLRHCLAAGRYVPWSPFLHPCSQAAQSCTRVFTCISGVVYRHHTCTWVDKDRLLAAPARSLATKDLEKKPLGFMRLDAQAIDMTSVPCPCPLREYAQRCQSRLCHILCTMIPMRAITSLY